MTDDEMDTADNLQLEILIRTGRLVEVLNDYLEAQQKRANYSDPESIQLSLTLIEILFKFVKKTEDGSIEIDPQFSELLDDSQLEAIYATFLQIIAELIEFIDTNGMSDKKLYRSRESLEQLFQSIAPKYQRTAFAQIKEEAIRETFREDNDEKTQRLIRAMHNRSAELGKIIRSIRSSGSTDKLGSAAMVVQTIKPLIGMAVEVIQFAKNINAEGTVGDDDLEQLEGKLKALREFTGEN